MDTINWNLEYMECVDSTNDEIKRRAQAGEGEGLVLIADRQTAGRGRLGRTFVSPEKTGLYMSLLLRPKMSGEEASCITTMAAAAMARAVEDVSGRKCGIKWVNDLMLDGKKICGILTEASFVAGTGKLDFVVLGIGLNISDPAGGFDETIRDIAGSVFGAEIREGAREELVRKFLEAFSGYYGGSKMRYAADYRARSIVVGKRITAISPDGEFEAVVLGIDDDCGLIVRRDDGREQTITTGEISIRI